MKISLKWLKDYIPGFETGSVESLCNDMIDAGFDIESVSDESETFKGFVVGEVLTRSKHPNADKLSVCTVNDGNGILNIVCGAPNVEAGQKVCVAKVGATVPSGGFEIKKTKIRGEVSEGMICSESELNLSDNHDGIMVLDTNAKTGMPFSEYAGLDDVVIEIGVTPNRGDLLSHFGVAREVAGIYGLEARLPEVKLNESGNDTGGMISIEIESKDYCKRFTGRVIENVRQGESPEWMKQRLTAAGMRPRNIVVDITNYVMLETGQPLHAFDCDRIRGKKIIVRTANDGDKFVTLDSKERTLSSQSLMVCDAEGYSAIAGIMGGEYSEITDNTKNVFLESAYFDAVNIRKNSKRLGLITDASQRFERGIDIDMVKYASLRAASLLSELAGGTVSKGLLDVYPVEFEPVISTMRMSRANKLLGTDLSEDDAVRLLGRIGIRFTGKTGDIMNFSIPESRRADLDREPDLIEELARLYGYSKIESSFDFRTSLLRGRDSESEKMADLKRAISVHLIGRGFNEIITIPLAEVSKSHSTSEEVRPIRLINSLTAEMNSMRTDLLDGMLRVIADNFNKSGKNISLRLFETGRVFEDKGASFSETDRIVFALSGKYDGTAFYEGERSYEMSDIKGELEMLLFKLNIETFRLFYYNDNQFGGVRIDVGLNGEVAGNINKADRNLLKAYDIESDVYFCRIDLGKLKSQLKPAGKFRSISKFPAVKRDIAVVVDRKTTFGDLAEILKKSGGPLLRSIELIDIYEGKQTGEGKKSMAFSLEFFSDEKTLTDTETGEAMKRIVKDLEAKAGAALRS